MKRLAELNGCDSVEDFSQKYFSKAGSKFICDKGKKLEAYTTPGEFYISREGALEGTTDMKLYGKRVLVLRGDHTKEASKRKQTLALHRVPSTPMGKLRKNVFNNKTTKDNRVSFGCVNFLVESYDKMRKFINGKNTKVYILPEENGNSLYLEKQQNGSFKFFQKKNTDMNHKNQRVKCRYGKLNATDS